MTPTPPDDLAVLISALLIAAIAGRVLADVVREVRMLLLSWLALRGTQPRQRVPIIAALRPGQQRLPPDKVGSATPIRVNRTRRERRSP